MSKAVPVNASILFGERQGRRVAIKTYRTGAKYSAGEEFAAYRALSELIKGMHHVRTAQIFEKDEASNSITIEYVAQPTLQEEVKRGKLQGLREARNSLIEVFSKASQKNVKFDADPTNIFVKAGDIVFIDPVCFDINLEDYAFVVFAWGLIKIMLRNWRFWLALALLKEFLSYRDQYARLNDKSIKSINCQVCSYIDVVIGWNKETNTVEGAATYWFRQILVVPLYRFVQLTFGRRFLWWGYCDGDNA